ncbi:MAG: UDP-N-acetylglucosamine 1-carboxyvinyltransferase [Spirochaetaceae bacterium]|nr:MAG: UDP-N-acetylglucosamine 1-carboxyvinyltransferase [Spirochaetaceae bacterium]
MYKYVIDGGFPLKGTIRASGNKNAALPCIAATLLTGEEIILRNVPDIEDVHVMAEILRSLGGSATREEDQEGVWRFCGAGLNTSEISPEMAGKIRASILFAGPLLARTGSVTLPPPGGDVIGRRRLDTHFVAFEGLGAQVKADGVFVLHARKLLGAELFLDEASVTATENAIMAAVTARGDTVIENAASEPHVQDLCNMLNAMGGKISGIGSNILHISGVESLHGTDFTLGADFMEVGSFIGLAAVTRGELTIENADPRQLKMTKIAFAKLGIRWETEGTTIHVPSRQNLRVVPDLGGMIPKIDDSPWPGFPPDLTSIMTVVATQVEGTVLIHEKMFESRMFFVDKLIGMGARIVLCDPHRAVVSGPSRLSGSQLTSPDVRAGMAMVIAALGAEGESVILNVYQIERGYENLTRRLRALGAHMKRVTVAG